jgi:hypothetical protein
MQKKRDDVVWGPYPEGSAVLGPVSSELEKQEYWIRKIQEHETNCTIKFYIQENFNNIEDTNFSSMFERKKIFK